MPEVKPVQKMSPEELIEKFQGDIIYDSHCFVTRFERSDAQKELVRRGKDVLQPMITHLKASPPDDGMNLNRAWGLLFANIENDIDPLKLGPNSLTNTEGWIAWAESMLSAEVVSE